MPFAEQAMRERASAVLLALAASLLVACGGGSSSSTTTLCRDAAVCVAQEVVQATPTGPNTTEIVVDSGPGFGLGVTNVPYVTVRVCNPGSTSACVTVDHVLLDTGSYGLRVLKSALPGLTLPPVAMAANTATGTAAGNVAECYPFVISAVWGPLVTADVQIGGEQALNIAVHVIDDGSPTSPAVPAACTSSGGLANSASQLQAHGILGIGVVGVDCGLTCESIAAQGMTAVYYTCPTSGAGCSPAAVPSAVQVQNPVAKFERNSNGTWDNNGTMIVMPALPDLGAVTARGRLVFGIGTQTNNQLPAMANLYELVVDPTRTDYLSVSVLVGSRSYAQSYIDSGANGLFFEDTALPRVCTVNGGVQGEWYCPASTSRRPATLTDKAGRVSPAFDLVVANADTLFNTGAVAFGNLAGSVGQGADTVALGLPFFYGRTVYTAIWGGSLSLNGPWYSF